MNKNTMILSITVVVVIALVTIYAIECNRQVMMARTGTENLHLLKSMQTPKMELVPMQEPQTGNPGRIVISGFMPS